MKKERFITKKRIFIACIIFDGLFIGNAILRWSGIPTGIGTSLIPDDEWISNEYQICYTVAGHQKILREASCESVDYPKANNCSFLYYDLSGTPLKRMGNISFRKIARQESDDYANHCRKTTQEYFDRFIQQMQNAN